ncbi:4'-phosphopantetheinyl transferase superfamily protein [Acinetobacter sp.]|uniref:4'-phosphopantetheinyl transferase family protein n=1 Tax=Acinetobacter sp. TaxID=472 RepID=UPI0031E3D605
MELPNRFIKSHKILFDPYTELYLALCEFDYQSFDESLFDELAIDRPVNLISSLFVRQSEFLAGRYAAKLALTAIDRKLCFDQVVVGLRKQPIFPDNLIGTLSHSHIMAICAVTTSKEVHYLGVDIEPTMTRAVSFAVERKVFTCNELNSLMVHGINREVAATLIFSAKESIFKAFSKQIKHGINFENIKLSTSINRNHVISMTFEVQELKLNKKVTVTARIIKDHILTLVAQ